MQIEKILIIDDDARNIFALRAVLKAKGFSVLSASTAAEGISMMLQEEGIKLVLMDIMMPDMDGLEALAIIRSHPVISGMPVIAVTAQAMVGDREKCIAAGANAYVSKPIDVDELLHLMGAFNGKHDA